MKNSEPNQARTLRYHILATAVAALSALNVEAGYTYDPLPPSWRGGPDTTYQAWSFSTPASIDVTPEFVSNLFGSPKANITVGQFGSGYLTSLPGLGSQTNFWDLGGSGGSISLEIPHAAGLAETVSVQVTYFQAITQPPMLSLTNSYGGGTLLSSTSTSVETVPALGQWITTSTLWLLTPAGVTDYEWFVSGGNGSVIESIVVDTKVAVPEPSVLALSALGAAVLYCVKRKRDRSARAPRES